ncbi:MAG: Tex-like N-terminal domain-containing protein [Planctomycetia bacterium]|nr:Tex-like N-terminal domain-containing protein [Planctomycetia bacterium]
MSASVASEIANRLGLKPARVDAVCKLLDEGYAPAFIGHYRKSETAGLRPPQVHHIDSLRRQMLDLQKCKDEALRVLERQGKLTPEVRQAVESARQKAMVEGLLLVCRPKGRTAAGAARDRGLSELAEYALAGSADGPDLPERAAGFIDHSREVHTTEDALLCAGHIIAEQFSENAALRRSVRDAVWQTGHLCSRKGTTRQKDAEFRDYYNFDERLSRVPPHRILAMNRGDSRGALKVFMKVVEGKLLALAEAAVVAVAHRFAPFLSAACRDAVKRLALPAIEHDARAELTRLAEQHAVEVFAANLRTRLQIRPVRGRRVLAINPGFRNGCKMIVLDADGKLLHKNFLYPLTPHKKWLDAKTILIAAIQQFAVDVVVIGNGAGCRETEMLVSQVIAENKTDVRYTVVNEAGASTYAASEIGRAEFPDLDASLRSAISVGRRLLDPLAELVKVDPRVIGVGLYQHDVNQDTLCRELDLAVRSCVAEVGVDLNGAGAALLAYVPGLSAALAEAVVHARAESGPFSERADLMRVEGFDEFIFTQCAGFLFIHDGTNPLDATRIHPEWYPIAERILSELGCAPADITTAHGRDDIRGKVKGLALDRLAERLEVAASVLLDIVGCLQEPGRDPRETHPGPIFRKAVVRIEDLKPGTWVNGVVRNVVDFGAFVDIGLDEDGLLHISQFSKHFVRNPLKFLHIGDTVKARILSIDRTRQRAALSMIPEEVKKVAPEPGQKPEGTPAEAPAAKPVPARPPAPSAETRKPGRKPPAAAAPRLPERGGRAAARSPRPERGGRPGTAARGRPEGGGRQGAADRSRPERRRSDKGPPTRKGPPTVHVFKGPDADKKPDKEEVDEKTGLPKLRWGDYE